MQTNQVIAEIRRLYGKGSAPEGLEAMDDARLGQELAKAREAKRQRRIRLLEEHRRQRNAQPIAEELLNLSEDELQRGLHNLQAEKEQIRVRMINLTRALDHKRTVRSAKHKLDALTPSERDAIRQDVTVRPGTLSMKSGTPDRA